MDKSRHILNLTQCVVFLIIALFLFSRITYLFRLISVNRENITFFSQEEHLDVVAVGASSTILYFQPYTAWDEIGVTSYDFATHGAQFDMYKYFMQEILRHQKPDVFVVDLRMLPLMCDPTTDEEFYENSMNFTNALNVTNPIKYITVYNYLSDHTNSNGGMVAYFFDIVKFHSDYTKLCDPQNWYFITNRKNRLYPKMLKSNRGYQASTAVEKFEKPDINWNIKSDLSPLQEKAVYDILDFCDQSGVNVCFSICPYPIGESELGILNTASDIIENRGYKVINCNKYYDSMKFDFSRDMKDVGHTNASGAEKYTRFICNFLKNNFELTDHRGDVKYSEWQGNAENFAVELETLKKEIDLK